MALLFMDGFDHYATADITKKWTTVNSPLIAATSGRRGGGAFFANANTIYIQKTLPSTYTTLIAGFAAWGWSTSDINQFAFREGSTYHVTLTYFNGRLKVYRGNPSSGGTLLGTGNTIIVPNAWNYIELKAVISDTVGAVEVRINGVADSGLTLSGIDTRNGGTGVIDNVIFDNYGYRDDFYVCDTSGSTNNDFLGDCRVDTLFPNADGNYSQFTPSTGTVHYSLVDESTPNTTDFNSSNTVGNRDSYAFSNLQSIASQTIYGVQINAATLKSDSGARSLGTMSRLSGTDKDGSGIPLPTSQVFITEIQETDPSNTAWTEANINAAEFGVKVTG